MKSIKKIIAWISALPIGIFAIGNLFATEMLAQEASQDLIVVEPLFEYPAAPEEMENLQERADWLVTHFWDKMNFKDKQTVDQNALNDAFQVYSAPMQFADAATVDASVSKLISSIAKNPALTLQFAKAAEECLYGPRAYFWSDPIYLKFVENVLKNKGVKRERKLRYEHQKRVLSSTLQGTVPPEFDYKLTDGKTAHYHPNGIITIIEFGDPECTDCRYAKLRMNVNLDLGRNIERGKVNVLFIIPDAEDGWEQSVSDYPAAWHVGASDEVADMYDLRMTPAIYVIDREGKIAAKNVDIDTAIEIANAAAAQM